MDEADCLSHNANILRKGLNPTTIPSAMDKIVGQTGFSNRSMTTGQREGKLDSNLLNLKLTLCRILLVRSG